MTVQIVKNESGYSYLSCDCDRTAVRIRTQSNGVQIYALQCLDCGRQIRAVSKNAPEILEMPNRIPFDEALKEHWRQRVQEHTHAQVQERERQQQERTTEWWQQYTAYLETTAWQLKRQAVLTRANNWCEGCGKRQATQVHHTTYKHVFDEFLFELVAVCEFCHRRIHPEMD